MRFVVSTSSKIETDKTTKQRKNVVTYDRKFMVTVGDVIGAVKTAAGAVTALAAAVKRTVKKNKDAKSDTKSTATSMAQSQMKSLMESVDLKSVLGSMVSPLLALAKSLDAVKKVIMIYQTVTPIVQIVARAISTFMYGGGNPAEIAKIVVSSVTKLLVAIAMNAYMQLKDYIWNYEIEVYKVTWETSTEIAKAIEAAGKDVSKVLISNIKQLGNGSSSKTSKEKNNESKIKEALDKNGMKDEVGNQLLDSLGDDSSKLSGLGTDKNGNKISSGNSDSSGNKLSFGVMRGFGNPPTYFAGSDENKGIFYSFDMETWNQTNTTTGNYWEITGLEIGNDIIIDAVSGDANGFVKWYSLNSKTFAFSNTNATPGKFTSANTIEAATTLIGSQYGVVYSSTDNKNFSTPVSVGGHSADGDDSITSIISNGNGGFVIFGAMEFDSSGNILDTKKLIPSKVQSSPTGRWIAGSLENTGLWWSDDLITWNHSNILLGNWGNITYVNSANLDSNQTPDGTFTELVFSTSFDNSGIVFTLDLGETWIETTLKTGSVEVSGDGETGLNSGLSSGYETYQDLLGNTITEICYFGSGNSSGFGSGNSSGNGDSSGEGENSGYGDMTIEITNRNIQEFLNNYNSNGNSMINLDPLEVIVKSSSSDINILNVTIGNKSENGSGLDYNGESFSLALKRNIYIIDLRSRIFSYEEIDQKVLEFLNVVLVPYLNLQLYGTREGIYNYINSPSTFADGSPKYTIVSNDETYQIERFTSIIDFETQCGMIPFKNLTFGELVKNEAPNVNFALYDFDAYEESDQLKDFMRLVKTYVNDRKEYEFKKLQKSVNEIDVDLTGIIGSTDGGDPQAGLAAIQQMNMYLDSLKEATTEMYDQFLLLLFAFDSSVIKRLMIAAVFEMVQKTASQIKSSFILINKRIAGTSEEYEIDLDSFSFDYDIIYGLDSAMNKYLSSLSNNVSVLSSEKDKEYIDASCAYYKEGKSKLVDQVIGYVSSISSINNSTIYNFSPQDINNNFSAFKALVVSTLNSAAANNKNIIQTETLIDTAFQNYVFNYRDESTEKQKLQRYIDEVYRNFNSELRNRMIDLEFDYLNGEEMDLQSTQKIHKYLGEIYSKFKIRCQELFSVLYEQFSTEKKADFVRDRTDYLVGTIDSAVLKLQYDIHRSLESNASLNIAESINLTNNMNFNKKYEDLVSSSVNEFITGLKTLYFNNKQRI